MRSRSKSTAVPRLHYEQSLSSIPRRAAGDLFATTGAADRQDTSDTPIDDAAALAAGRPGSFRDGHAHGSCPGLAVAGRRSIQAYARSRLRLATTPRRAG